MAIEYREFGAARIDEIRPLWEKLNVHHADVSSHFTERFEAYTFEKRKKSLLAEAEGGQFLIVVAHDPAEIRDIGYCISTLKDSGRGEIESLFLEQSHRGRGIGDVLMERSLQWLDRQGAVEKIIHVVSGNEQACGFYERYGFVPHCTVLLQKDK